MGGMNMKISTKGRYALRMMLDIAQHSEEKPVSVKEIAARQEVSDKYLEQIISLLNGAGYVRSIRGPQGGYLLRKKPEEYTVGMILRLTEGTLSPVPCVEEDAIPCDREAGCVTVKLWRKLNNAISDVVDHVTLADLLEWDENGKDPESL
jgi:Rrf2 family protein